QRRPDRRPEDRHRQRVVRSPTVRHRERLQDLRGELPRSGAPGRAGARGAGAGRRRDRWLPMTTPPFPPGYRASGVLLHVSSLPSPYGIGDVGPAALAWVDRLHAAGQSWWQALPLGPTGYGNSPYQSLSSFAGNELLVSPDGLIEDGLLRTCDCEGKSFSAASVDYDAVIPFKNRLLETAWATFS